MHVVVHPREEMMKLALSERDNKCVVSCNRGRQQLPLRITTSWSK